MLPLPNRWLSSVLIRHGRHLVLFDCGEGTQISLSHVHGDHVGGLPGLLLTQGNSGRTDPIDILGPPGLSETVSRLRVIAPQLPFEVRCHDLQPPAKFELHGLDVSCAEADHHVRCLGYRLDLARGREFLPDWARSLSVPIEHWKQLQQGQAVAFDGRLVEPDAVLGPPRRGLSIGLVTDTRPTDALASLARDVDLLICEGTYGSDDDQPRAVERKHMTFAEAAQLAKRAGARRLLLTHFSPALVTPADYTDVARSIFEPSIVGHDHLTLELTYSD
jgi:ribonuclease Z